MDALLGVVLCGGQSTRMGSDKGLLPINNTIWAQYVANKLSELGLRVVFSINKTQEALYLEHLSAKKLIIDNTAIAVEGPLKGLLSIHQKYPSNNLLMLSCDMLDVDTHTIATIIAQQQQHLSYQFYVYHNGQFAEPFCGIYTAYGLKNVLKNAENQLLKTFSLQSVLNNVSTYKQSITYPQAFKSYNTPD